MGYEAGQYDVIVVGAGHAGVEAALGVCQTGRQNACLHDQPGYGCFHAMQSVCRRSCKRDCRQRN